MNRKHGFRAALTFLAFVLLLGFALPGGTETAYSRDGYWKRVWFQIFYEPETDGENHYYKSFFDFDRANIVYTEHTPEGSNNYEVQFTWDVPKERYDILETFDITLNAEILQCQSASDDDTYLGSESITVMFYRSTGVENPWSKEYLFSSEGYRAIVDAVVNNDNILFGEEDEFFQTRDTVTVSGQFHKGIPRYDKGSLDSGENAWIFIIIEGLGNIAYQYEFTEYRNLSIIPRFVDYHSGWWELESVEPYLLPESKLTAQYDVYPGTIRRLERGLASSYYSDPKDQELWHVSFFWIEPEERYAALDTIYPIWLRLVIEKFFESKLLNEKMLVGLMLDDWEKESVSLENGHHFVEEFFEYEGNDGTRKDVAVYANQGKMKKECEIGDMRGHAPGKPSANDKRFFYIVVEVGTIGYVFYKYVWRE